MNDKMCPCTISLLLSGVTANRHSPDTHSASQSFSSFFFSLFFIWDTGKLMLFIMWYLKQQI